MKQYANDVDNFAPAEKFLYVMGSIPFYEMKLRALFFVASFDELVADAKRMISWLGAGIKDVKESGQFKELLKVWCFV